MIKFIKKSVLLLTIPILFNGCFVSKFFSVGSEESYCKEFGCDFSDVGVCASPVDILINKDDLSEIQKYNDMERKNAESKSMF